MSAWPVVLSDIGPSGAVVLRPLTRRDRQAWYQLRSDNRDWLRPWEASNPIPGEHSSSFGEYLRWVRANAKAGTAYSFAVDLNGTLVGQLTISAVQYGSLCSAVLGYWIARSAAGRGVIPTAVALATDYCLSTLRLHRVEVNIRPENARSLRVVAKLGFRDEGVRRSYLHINGAWADHRTFALCSEDLPEGLLARWHRLRGPQ